MWNKAQSHLAEHIFTRAQGVARSLAVPGMVVDGKSVEDLPCVVVLEFLAGGQTRPSGYSIARRTSWRWQDARRRAAHIRFDAYETIARHDGAEPDQGMFDYCDLSSSDPATWSPDRVIERAEEKEREKRHLLRAFRRIREGNRNQAKAFTLVDIRHMSYGQAARRLRKPVGTVKCDVSRARRFAGSVIAAGTG